MGRLKCFWKHEGCILDKRDDNKVFQDWIFPADGRDELLHICDARPKADATDAITLFESKGQSFFIFCSNVRIFRFAKVVDNKWKGR